MSKGPWTLENILGAVLNFFLAFPTSPEETHVLWGSCWDIGNKGRWEPWHCQCPGKPLGSNEDAETAQPYSPNAFDQIFFLFFFLMVVLFLEHLLECQVRATHFTGTCLFNGHNGMVQHRDHHFTDVALRFRET